jgi:hypothetical protein
MFNPFQLKANPEGKDFIGLSYKFKGQSLKNFKRFKIDSSKEYYKNKIPFVVFAISYFVLREIFNFQLFSKRLQSKSERSEIGYF